MRQSFKSTPKRVRQMTLTIAGRGDEAKEEGTLFMSSSYDKLRRFTNIEAHDVGPQFSTRHAVKC